MKYTVVFLIICVSCFIAIIGVIASIIKQNDERAEFIIQKTCTNTLCIMFVYLIFCVVEQSYNGLNNAEIDGINPFIQLSILSIVYLIQLVYFKKSMEIDMENRIRFLRKEKNISQEDLAKKCDVTRQTINAIENNKYDPTLALAFKLSKVLGVTVDELFIFNQ